MDRRRPRGPPRRRFRRYRRRGPRRTDEEVWKDEQNTSIITLHVFLASFRVERVERVEVKRMVSVHLHVVGPITKEMKRCVSNKSVLL